MDRLRRMDGLQPAAVAVTDLDLPTLRCDDQRQCWTSGVLKKKIYSYAHARTTDLIIRTAPKTTRLQQILRRIFRQAHLPPHIYIVLSSTTNWHDDFERKFEMTSDGAIFYKGYPIYLVDEMSALIDFLVFVRKERRYTGEVHIIVAVNEAYRLCWADVWANPPPIHLYGWKDNRGQPFVTLYSKCSSDNGSRKFEGNIDGIILKPWDDRFDSDGGISDASSAVVSSEASRVDSAVSVPSSKPTSIYDDVPIQATQAMSTSSPMSRSRSMPPSSLPKTLDPICDGRFHGGKENIEAADFKYYLQINALNQLMRPSSQHLVESKVFLLDSGVSRDSPKGSSLEVQRAREAWHRLRRYDYSAKEGIADPDPTEGEGAEDKTGHGTRVASLFLRTAPSARLTVCKVVNDREDLETGHWKGCPSAPLVAKALRKAREERADIIIMPLGFRAEHPLVEAEFDLIEKQDKNEVRQTLIICSTSNDGQTNNTPVSWPASRPGIFGVSAADYFGEPDGRAPRADDSNPGGKTNYLSLGAKVIVFRRDGEPEVNRASAASYAAPTLGALAALILQTLRTYSQDTTKPKAAAALRGIEKEGWEFLFKRFATKPTPGYDPFLPLWEALTPVPGMDGIESALENIHKKYSSLGPEYDVQYDI